MSFISKPILNVLFFGKILSNLFGIIYWEASRPLLELDFSVGLLGILLIDIDGILLLLSLGNLKLDSIFFVISVFIGFSKLT